MKKRALFTALRQAADAAMPDVRHKINLESINVTVPEPKAHALRPEFARLFVSLFLLVAVSTGLYFGFVDNQSEVFALESPEEIIGYQVLSGSAFAVNYVNTTLSMPLADPVDPSLIETNIDRLINYLTVFESLLGKRDEISFVLSASDNPAYTAMIVIHTTDIDGEVVNITMYLDTMPDETTTSYSGSIEFETETVNFVYESGLLTITTGVCRLEVLDESNATTQQFRYMLYVSNTLRWTSEVSLVYENEELQVDVETEIDAMPFRLRIAKTVQTKKMSVTYTFGDTEIVEQGVIDVENVYNTETSEFEYRCNATITVGNSQRDITIHGNRDKGAMPHHGGGMNS